jgi:hypothetical protein
LVLVRLGRGGSARRGCKLRRIPLPLHGRLVITGRYVATGAAREWLRASRRPSRPTLPPQTQSCQPLLQRHSIRSVCMSGTVSLQAIQSTVFLIITHSWDPHGCIQLPISEKEQRFTESSMCSSSLLTAFDNIAG